jgi:uncharacterized protein
LEITYFIPPRSIIKLELFLRLLKDFFNIRRNHFIGIVGINATLVGFSVEVAKEWEKAFFSFDLTYTRQAALRIAIVLGPDGGVMNPYKNLVKFGLGGVQGPGNQMFSWIHIEDLFRIILFLKYKKGLSGVFNCSSPNPVTNREFMEHLRTVMNKKAGLSTSKWMLEIGAFFIKTEPELVLKSRWVVPKRLEEEGYQFKYETVGITLRHILSH